jgi:hypothetical protein
VTSTPIIGLSEQPHAYRLTARPGKAVFDPRLTVGHDDPKALLGRRPLGAASGSLGLIQGGVGALDELGDRVAGA